jgi:hypothetical protein
MPLLRRRRSIKHAQKNHDAVRLASDTGTSKATNFANPFVLELLEELRIVQGLVRRENEQRTAGLTIPPSLPARACEAIE